MKTTYQVHPDIRKAETLPATFYKSPEVFEALKEKVFGRTWQWLGVSSLAPLTETAHPLVILPNFLNEPVVLVNDKNGMHKCFSNVCTHRGNIIIHNPGKSRNLVCGYHGRKFGLDGNMKFMPEFDDAENFPRACDHLHEFPLAEWGPFLFAGINPKIDFNKIIEEMNERVGFLPLHEFKHSPAISKDYLVNCHWALYCDNYLEGFHIPFVHTDLNAVLDYGNYEVELFDYLNLQVGYAESGEEVFDLPEGHPDFGKHVAAYYYWVFPNMMFNFYPWGLSVNIVKPIGIDKTKVSFLTYIYDESKLHSGAGALLDKVEREDEFVVEGVQNGIQSRFYKSGRFSPKREKGVHHFHRLLAEFINN